jgi:hypothetical protein
VQTYTRVWCGVTRALVLVGAVVPLAAWCIASPWTFALGFAAGCWAGRTASRSGPDGVAAQLRRRLLATPVVEEREWQLVRRLPAVMLAIVGWTQLLGAAGAALLLVAGVFGLPLLAAYRPDRWPDGRDVGHIPDTVEELAPADVAEVVERVDRRENRADRRPTSPMAEAVTPSTTPPERWPGPRTLLPDLDDDELLHAWESSTRALSLEPGPAAMLRIVRARAHYLDALAERDPDGVARRLGEGGPDDWTPFDPPV